MRGKGINYDTGFSPGGRLSREDFDAGLVRREMQVIASELRCTAVRITGGEPERLSVAGELAAAAGYRGLGWEPKAAFGALAGLGNDQADS
jgi:hypothetical protein